MDDAEITRAFAEVLTVFPFPGYMDFNLSKYKTIIKQITKNAPRSSKILSIGCGACDFEAILSKLGYRLTAVDDLRDYWHSLGKNRERIMDFAKRMNIELTIDSFGSLQERKNYFDVVLLIDIIEHLHSSPRELLNYSISSLKPDGLLIIETPNAVALAKRLLVLAGRSSQISAGFFYWNIGEYRSHIREYTRSELKQILHYHKLSAVDSRMANIMVCTVQTSNLAKKALIKIYGLISGLYPNCRDTVIIWGRKPKDWEPTDSSVVMFSKYYEHLTKYDLDDKTN